MTSPALTMTGGRRRRTMRRSVGKRGRKSVRRVSRKGRKSARKTRRRRSRKGGQGNIFGSVVEKK